MRERIRRIALLLALTLSASHVGASDGAWELVDDADGVRVWRREVSDSSVLAFRGAGEVEVSIARLVSVLVDSSRSTEWVDLLAESRRLRQDGALESILYNRYDLAWPVQDRDYVLHRQLAIEPHARRVTATYRSVDDPAWPPRACCIRAETDPTFWRFTQLGPSRTFVEVEVFTDPKGSIPAWLVNVIQRGWPRNSIHRLAERASDPDVTPYPALADW